MHCIWILSDREQGMPLPLNYWLGAALDLVPGWLSDPSGTSAEKRADADDDFELVGESTGLAEESNEDRRAAQKGHCPSSMGLSFLAAQQTRSLTVTVR
jgi:hypothetical protein